MNIDLIFRACQMAPLFLPIVAVVASTILHSSDNKIRCLALGQWTALATSTLGLFWFIFCQHTAPADIVLVPTLVTERMDLVAVGMAAVIGAISVLAVFFGERSLSGDRGEKYSVSFVQHLVGLATVATWLAGADSLYLLVACWTGISFLLWRLLGMRPEGVASARLVLGHHLFSDILLLSAAGLILFYCQTANLSTLSSHVAILQTRLFGLFGILLVLAMAVKSALFPFQRWLLGMIDGPTVLSAMLHGGVVNVSFVLGARTMPILCQSAGALILLACLATLSAVLGTLVCATKSAVKAKLVYSTSGQMGFMVLQLAVGGLSMALFHWQGAAVAGIALAFFHLIAHSPFKALLFLRAGSVVAEGLRKKKVGYASSTEPMTNGRRLAAVFLFVAALAICSWLLLDPAAGSKSVLSAVIVSLAILWTLPTFNRIGGGVLLVGGISYLAAVTVSRLVSNRLDEVMGPVPAQTEWLWAVCVGVFAFIGLLVHSVQNTGAGRALYVHALNAFYLEEVLAAVKSRVGEMRTKKLPGKSSA
jgi:NADH:ubiquinone oxidoreductase subunit 5 (subunit L)/multisubunit Na+/H+ antiporter MnhA subunit